ncbi:MAG: hypothetical protein K8S97_12535 [Anaerolineae bacterium]|nr:hypothetical protein [Anaerolineae bacterium]
MAQYSQPSDKNPSQAGSWIAPFGDVFIGLDDTAVIRRVVGNIDTPAGPDKLQVQGLTWLEFVEHFATEDTKSGLRHLWLAIAEQRVAPIYHPSVVPFKPGVVARLRAVDGDPIVSYACHLTPAETRSLDALIGPQTPGVTQHLIHLIQNVFRGVHGPLTDSQVNAMRGILTIAETVNHLLHDLRTEVIAPTHIAPLPHSLAELFTFSTRDFADIRRIVTHELRLTSTLADDITIYSYPTVRDIMRRILETLLGGIIARTAITITSASHDADNVQVTITYQTQEPALRAEQHIDPIPLLAADRFQVASTLQCLITTMQSYVTPVNGLVWAAPVPDKVDTIQVCIILPRWQDDTSQSAANSTRPAP